ncbi:MAG: DNA-processing protein DprA [Gammaproteobacteria bacterium]|nr:MAG: DNA-processing protein DprA [Gammaproteobacteria bacterium]
MNDENRQTILLLTSYFCNVKGDFTPLTAIEYGRFASWLHQNKFDPKDLLGNKANEIFTQWKDPKGKITQERIEFLLGRGLAMGLAVEKWTNAGIWILTRLDPEYPSRLKKKLGPNAPAIIFGIGNKRLLNAGGISVVGSRNVDSEDQDFTKHISQQAASEGLNVISGGARGVDECAMLASLEVEGNALGVLANDLLKACISGKWRKFIKNNQLALISISYPEASFNVGHAMGRNKYIYCLSDYSLVVRSEEDKGGTWAGAKENLKKKWVPLFVKTKSDATGNLALLNMGGVGLDINIEDMEPSREWLLTMLNSKNHKVESDEVQQTEIVVKEVDVPSEKDRNIDIKVSIKDARLDFDKVDLFFCTFKAYLEHKFISSEEISLSDLDKLLADVTKKQITEWLDRAVKEGSIIRKGRARCYSQSNSSTKQAELFV